MKTNRDDQRAPNTPQFSAPCGAQFNSAGEVIGHTQVCESCMIAQGDS